MTADPFPFSLLLISFESLAAAELRKLGITLACLPPRHALKGVS